MAIRKRRPYETIRYTTYTWRDSSSYRSRSFRLQCNRGIGSDVTEPDFNFIADVLKDVKRETLVPEVVRKTPLDKMTPRKFGQTILEVFGRVGGADWLLQQAIADPRGFIELLKKILPRQIEMDNLDGLTVLLRDQYGNELEINPLGRVSPTPAIGGSPSSEPGQLSRTATGGNHTEVVLKEVFD